MGTNTRAPGFSTLLSNLLRVDGAFPDTQTWQQKYLYGVGFELYSTHLSGAFEGLTFYEAVLAMYDMFGVVILGLRALNGAQSIQVLPRNVTLAKGDTVFLIAADRVACAAIQHLQTVPAVSMDRRPVPDYVSSRIKIRRLVSEGHIRSRLENKGLKATGKRVRNSAAKLRLLLFTAHTDTPSCLVAPQHNNGSCSPFVSVEATSQRMICLKARCSRMRCKRATESCWRATSVWGLICGNRRISIRGYAWRVSS
jgi:hypothetical protein